MSKRASYSSVNKLAADKLIKDYRPLSGYKLVKISVIILLKLFKRNVCLSVDSTAEDHRSLICCSTLLLFSCVSDLFCSDTARFFPILVREPRRGFSALSMLRTAAPATMPLLQS